MPKASRNRPGASEKIAQQRAREARRRRRRLWLIGSGAVAVVVVVAVILALTLGGSSPGTFQSAPPAGPLGPEGVPVPTAPALASTVAMATGQPVDGIRCQTSEQTLFHIHAHLTIFVDGSPRQVPAGVGIPAAQAQQTPRGPFIDSGTCFYWLHTHAADGIVHIESPVHRVYTLGDFFDEWGQPLGAREVGPAKGVVTALDNGRVYRGNPRDIPLTRHARIQLEVGRPLIAAEPITWPAGL